MQHARSDLCLVQASLSDENILLETLCFHAQQAAEKAIKAVLVSSNIEFPRTHNIRTLVELLPGGGVKNPVLDDATVLTEYAVSSRYPGESEIVTEEELREALELAENVVAWAKAVLGK